MSEIKNKVLKTELIEWRKLKELQPKGFKELTKENYEKLKKSIITNNFAMPFTVWESKTDIFIIDGHHRYKVLDLLDKEGVNVPEKLPCTFIDCKDKKEASKLVLMYSSIYAKVQDEGLYEFMNIEGLDFDVIKAEFDIPNIDFERFELGYFKEQDEEKLNDIPDVNENAISKLGDIFLIDGKHRVMCGDSTKESDVSSLMDGKRADLLLTDPPYELETRGGGVLKNAKSMKEIRNNKVDSFDLLSLNYFCKTNIYFHNKPLIKKYIELSERQKLNYDLCIYKKEHSVPNYNSHLKTDIEYIAILGELNPNKNLEYSLYSKVFIGNKDRDNGLSYSKPVNLCIKFVLLYSHKSVLDLFLGSGTTLIASEQTNRICYGMELDPVYIDVILKRYKKLYPESKFECLNRKYNFKELFKTL